MLRVESPRWFDFTGSMCESCGKRREMRYIFPILVQVYGKQGEKTGTKRMCPVCYECIAAGMMPKDVKQADLPWYDPKGQRLNGGKVHVALA